jgi:hypothetical protein
VIDGHLPYDATRDEGFLPSWINPLQIPPPTKFLVEKMALSPDERYFAGTVYTWLPDSVAKATRIRSMIFHCVYDLIADSSLIQETAYPGGFYAWSRDGKILVNAAGPTGFIWKKGEAHVDWSWFNRIGISWLGAVSWSPTSNYFYFFGTTNSGKSGIHRSYEAAGPVETLIEASQWSNVFEDFAMLDDQHFLFYRDTSLFIYDLTSRSYRRLPQVMDPNNIDTVTYSSFVNGINPLSPVLGFRSDRNECAVYYHSRIGDGTPSARITEGVAIYNLRTYFSRRIWEIPDTRLGNGYQNGVAEGVQLLKNGNFLLSPYSTIDSTYTTWEISSETGRRVRKVLYFGKVCFHF